MSAPSSGMVTRRILPVALERLAESEVLLLEGPRSVGKSTLLKEIAQDQRAAILDLDDPATRDAVGTDPAPFIAGPGPICIDEYLKAPNVLDAIKAELNRDDRPGRFVLAGSARHDSLPGAAEALTGRLSRLMVNPLSQGEIEDASEDLIERLFADPNATVAARPTSTTTRTSYIDRLVAGGFPLALQRSTPSARARWFDDYVRLTLERDVRELSRIRQGGLLAGLLDRLTAQTAQVLNIESAARDVGLDPDTADSYTRLLEAVFLLYRLPAWGKTLGSRTGATPKLHVLDSGLAARRLRLGSDKLARRDPTALTELGHLMETFVIGELLKQATWMEGIAGFGHWRTHDHDEVDLVLEHDDGRILAFEVKTAGRVPGDDFDPLRKLRSRTGENFVAGVALYAGSRSYNFEDRLYAMPIDRVWLG